VFLQKTAFFSQNGGKNNRIHLAIFSVALEVYLQY
jgi:hypothetical protein